MPDPALEPCPFCGATDTGALGIQSDVFGVFRASCVDCGGVGPPGSTIDDARIRWNMSELVYRLWGARRQIEALEARARK